MRPFRRSHRAGCSRSAGALNEGFSQENRQAGMRALRARPGAHLNEQGGCQSRAAPSLRGSPTFPEQIPERGDGNWAEWQLSPRSDHQHHLHSGWNKAPKEREGIFISQPFSHIPFSPSGSGISPPHPNCSSIPELSHLNHGRSRAESFLGYFLPGFQSSAFQVSSRISSSSQYGDSYQSLGFLGMWQLSLQISCGISTQYCP